MLTSKSSWGWLLNWQMATQWLFISGLRFEGGAGGIILCAKSRGALRAFAGRHRGLRYLNVTFGCGSRYRGHVPVVSDTGAPQPIA
ncbi:hypothetical protein NicSoilB8_26190 [Arthrobacter sp. NicSoilB8]|nr:hypothetical protein NicSoilB8_26190 [Arthrobacter sp. NicSoilB8]